VAACRASVAMKVVATQSEFDANTGTFLVTVSSAVGTPKDAVKGIVNAN
jgi:hypothetical protein